MKMSVLNESGTNIIKNIENCMLQKSYTINWINFVSKCSDHRKAMISTFLTSKIYRLVKDKNEQIRQSKCWDQTRRQLRNQ